MRYIKEYKIFESLYKSIAVPGAKDEIIDDIKEILLPISDLGYNIDVKLIFDIRYHIFISILNYKYPILELTEEIIDEFDRLNNFIKNYNFKIDTVYYKKVAKDGRVFNREYRETSSYDFFRDKLKNSKLAFLTLELKTN